MKPLDNGVALIARIFLAVLFILSGIQKVAHYGSTGEYMAGHGLPAVAVLLPLAILMELGGGVLIVIGLFTRPVAVLMFLFLIPVTWVFHTSGDQANTVQLLKNISIAGGMLLLYACGPGRYSLDARLNRR